MNESSFKIVLLGEGCVGKTSLLLRYVQNQFVDKHIQTIQASFLSKKINVDGRRVELAIWDTAGQERFHALGPIYYRDADGGLLVYDIADKQSFERVQSWVRELRKVLGRDINLAIVGNKCDLEKNRVVSIADAEEYAESVGAKHYLTSAKLNRGINELFFEITKQMLAKQKTIGSGRQLGAAGAGARRRGGLMIGPDDNERPEPSKGGCC